MDNQLQFAKHGKKFSFMKSRLFRSFFCVFLSICLVLGTSVDLSFASELLPDGPQDVYISQLSSQTLDASKDASNASSYKWEIYAPDMDEFIPINGETNSTLEADAALVKNVLDANNIAKIQCLSYNAENVEVASKLYIVHFDPSTDSFNQQIEDSAINEQLGNLTGETIYSVGDTEENSDLTITVSYWTTKGQALGIENTRTFTKENSLEWYLQVINLSGATLATTNPVQYDNKEALDNVGFTAEIVEGSGIYYNTKGIYIMHDSASGAIPAGINKINVKVYFDMADIAYHVKAYYQDKDQDDVYHMQETDRYAPIGTAVPTIVSEGTYISDIDYFSTSFYEGDPEGWEAVNFHQQDLTIQDQTTKKTIELNFNRTYTICRFDPNGGVNGPTAIYMKHGDTFQNVNDWIIEDGQKVPTPKPTRDAYIFDGWTDDDGQDVTTWGDIPGKDTIYHAKWKLSLPEDASINVTIAYYCEKADTTDYEYMIERYDHVPVAGFQEGVTTYTLPANASSTDPYKDRRFPQVRQSSSDEYTLKTPSTIEQVEGAPSGKTYKDLFYYDASAQPTDSLYVKADGTTICKVFLKRVPFTYKFYNGSSYSGALVSGGEITAKWDQNIWNTFKQVCLNKTNQQSDNYPWLVESTNAYRNVITHMGFADDNFRQGSMTTSGDGHIRYYTQLVGKDWNIPTNPTASDFEYLIGETPNPNFVNIVDVAASESSWTTIDEFINILGFITPNPLDETVAPNSDEYYGGPKIHSQTYLYKSHREWQGWSRVTVVDWNGLKYFYKRNKNSLYLRNIHGVSDNNPETGKPYHYDNCCVIASRDMSNNSATDGGVQFEYPISNLTFQITERQEPSSGVDGGEGITGIKKGDSFMSFIPTVPDNVDQHYVFAGWYEDEAFTNQVTSYDYKTGTHTVVNNWTMPNHQQDLYAKWVPPERKIEFFTATDPVLSVKNSVSYTSDPSHLGESAKVLYGDLINNEEYKVFPSVDDRKDTFKGYRFVSWFYYKSDEDFHADKPTYFDPTNMTMPWCDYGDAPWPVTDAAQNYEEPVLQLFELWLPESQLYYQVNYVIKGSAGQPDTVVADPTIGKGAIGETITAVAKDPINNPDTFLYKYRGILDYAEGEPDDHTKTLTLSIEEDNVINFYYELDNDKSYEYKIFLVITNPNDPADIRYVRKGEETYPTFENSAFAKSSDFPLATEDLPAEWTDRDPSNYMLKSPNEQTINLIHNPNFEQFENCILFYYTYNVEGTKRTFNYSIFTAKSESELTTPREDGLNGGALLNESQGYKHVNTLEHEVIDGQSYEYAFCMPSPGFKFVKWQVKNPATETEWVDVPDAQWTQFDDGSIRLLCAHDEPSGKFDNDRAYQAIFVESDNVSISYQAVTVNSQLEEVTTYTCGSITTDGTTTNFNPVYKEEGSLPVLQTATPHKLNYFQYFNFVGWYTKNAEGKFVKVEGAPTTLTAWEPSPSTTTDVSGVSYYYYEGGDYFALFDESAVPITYNVNPTGTGTLSSYSESVMPHAENATGSTATAATHYQFKNWTSDQAGTQEVCSTEKYVPGKTSHTSGGEYFEPGTYYAQFSEAVYTVTFECGEHGSISADPAITPPYKYTVSDDGKINISADAISAEIVSVSKSIDSTITASPDTYYIVDYWSYTVDGGDEQIFSGEYTVNSDVTIKVAFKNIPDINFTFKVHKYDEQSLDPGKIDVGETDLFTEKTIQIPIASDADIPNVSFSAADNSLKVIDQNSNSDLFIAKAVPDSHSGFLYWTRTEVKDNPQEIIYGDGDDVRIAANYIFTAYFVSLHDIDVIANGGGTIVSPTETINEMYENAKLVYTTTNDETIPELDIIYDNLVIEDYHVKAVSNPMHHFVGWTYKDSKSLQPDVAVPFPDGGINLLRSVGDITLIANFEPNALNALFETDGNGTVDPSEESISYGAIAVFDEQTGEMSFTYDEQPFGTNAVLTPNEGKMFDHWTVTDDSAEEVELTSPYTIKTDVKFKAYFKDVPDPGGEIINAQTGDSPFVYVLAGIALASIAVFVLRRRKSNKA